MTVRILAYACACTLCGLLAFSACSSQRPAPASGAPAGDPSTCGIQAGGPVTGDPVTKDVPHSTESFSDIKEREAKEPLPPRGDVAIPSHRIRRGDNTVEPPPADKPAAK